MRPPVSNCKHGVAVAVLILFLTIPLCAAGVLTADYDAGRTGANTSETVLTPAIVSSPAFQKRATWTTDDLVYGQPLVYDGSPRLLIVATANDTVYAFDADRAGTTIWSRHLDTALVDAIRFGEYNGHVGCLATPVIDTGNALVWALCVNSSHAWHLYALSLTDGSVQHTATISCTANGVTFSGANQLSRTALLLDGGNIYFGFGAYGADVLPFQGWVFAYAASSGSQVACNSTVNSSNGEGGVWAVGGLAADGSGNVYFGTGNGDCSGSPNLAESVLEASGTTLAITSSLTDNMCAADSASDLDQGAGRVILVGSKVIAGGKNDWIWVVPQGSLGGLQDRTSPSGGRQAFDSFTYQLFDARAFANNTLYLISQDGNGGGTTTLKSFAYSGSAFTTTPAASQAGYTAYLSGMTYSSNGAASGIVWLTSCAAFNETALQAGALRAFDGTTLALLFDSTSLGGDALGSCAKYSPPTVINGRVYVSSFSNAIVAYSNTALQPAPAVSVRSGVTVSGGTMAP